MPHTQCLTVNSVHSALFPSRDATGRLKGRGCSVDGGNMMGLDLHLPSIGLAVKLLRAASRRSGSLKMQEYSSPCPGLASWFLLLVRPAFPVGEHCSRLNTSNAGGSRNVCMYRLDSMLPTKRNPKYPMLYQVALRRVRDVALRRCPSTAGRD